MVGVSEIGVTLFVLRWKGIGGAGAWVTRVSVMGVGIGGDGDKSDTTVRCAAN